jgi:hypothetical protein
MLRSVAVFLAWSVGALCATLSFSQDSGKQPGTDEPARVFITDSQSWETAGYGAGSGGSGGSAVRGGARPQTAEIIKTFGQRCPTVKVNNIQEKADYIVLLDHEGGKSLLSHKNKVAVFTRATGDSLVSKSTLSLGGSVQEACEAILKDWPLHGAQLREAALAAASGKASAPQSVPAASAPVSPVPSAASGKLSVGSTPDGADIEVDGSFVGNTPSSVQVPEGEHTVTVKKEGFKNWERKLKVSAGSDVHLNAEIEKLAAQ